MPKSALVDGFIFTRTETARYAVELKILNYDLEEILDDGILEVLVQMVQDIWNTKRLYVTKVSTSFVKSPCRSRCR